MSTSQTSKRTLNRLKERLDKRLRSKKLSSNYWLRALMEFKSETDSTGKLTLLFKRQWKTRPSQRCLCRLRRRSV